MAGPASAGFWIGLSIPRQLCVPYAARNDRGAHAARQCGGQFCAGWRVAECQNRSAYLASAACSADTAETTGRLAPARVLRRVP